MQTPRNGPRPAKGQQKGGNIPFVNSPATECDCNIPLHPHRLVLALPQDWCPIKAGKLAGLVVTVRSRHLSRKLLHELALPTPSSSHGCSSP